jgi:hypothetical protein
MAAHVAQESLMSKVSAAAIAALIGIAMITDLLLRKVR